jgi:hypothetical protein
MKLAHGQIEWANLRAKTPRRRKLAHFPEKKEKKEKGRLSARWP